MGIKLHLRTCVSWADVVALSRGFIEREHATRRHPFFEKDGDQLHCWIATDPNASFYRNSEPRIVQIVDGVPSRMMTINGRLFLRYSPSLELRLLWEDFQPKEQRTDAKLNYRLKVSPQEDLGRWNIEFETSDATHISILVEKFLHAAGPPENFEILSPLSPAERDLLAKSLEGWTRYPTAQAFAKVLRSKK